MRLHKPINFQFLKLSIHLRTKTIISKINLDVLSAIRLIRYNAALYGSQCYDVGGNFDAIHDNRELLLHCFPVLFVGVLDLVQRIHDTWEDRASVSIVGTGSEHNVPETRDIHDKRLVKNPERQTVTLRKASLNRVRRLFQAVDSRTFKNFRGLFVQTQAFCF